MSRPSDDTDPTGPALGAWDRTPDTPLFAPGDRVAGRFEIQRFLGAGGMGHVYAAHDLELRGDVALKMVRPEIARSEKAMEWFRREIQMSRRVTHPNVCRVYDVFWHRAGGQEVALVSMELLEGGTLASRLRGGPRLAPGEALPLVADMAAGLDAAHRAGVVHGDFKPANVILPEAGSPRAVVTDFGLARRFDPEEVRDDPTGSLLVMGTAAYMSPEQVEGLPVTPRSDVYAFGIVLYEMMTGRLPFEGASPLSTAVRRLKHAPPPPDEAAPDLPEHWSRVILSCLARDPDDRPASPGAAAAGLTRPGPPPRAERRARLRGKRAAAVVVPALVGLLGLAYAIRPPARPAAAVAEADRRRAVALLGFKNLSGRADADWLSVALAEMLRTELAAARRLRTISGEDVARMKAELALAEADSLAGDTLRRVRANLDTDVVVLGSYLALGDRAGGKLRVDLRVQDASLGETIASVTETGTEVELPDLVSRTGQRLRDALGGGEATSDASARHALLPGSPDARRLYAEGLGRLRVFDARAARELLERAVAAEPEHPAPHAALAEAWAVLGYDGRAREEARKAFELSAGLPPEAREWAEARHREVARDWDGAVEAYRRLWARQGDELESGLRLADVQRAAGRGAEALQTALRLAERHPDDPRVLLAEAGAAAASSDYRRQQEAASRAARLAEARGARLLVAAARVLEGEAFQNLGEPARASRAYAAARGLYQAAGDRAGVSLALSREGIVQWFQGDPVGARAAFEQSLATSREIGNVRGEARARLNIGNTLLDEGRLSEAAAAYEAALALFRDAGDRQGAARALNNIATAAQARGRLDEAQRRFEESVAAKQEIGDRQGAALTAANLGSLALARGRVAEARKALEAALLPLRGLGNRHGEAVALHALGDVMAASGEPRAARQRYTEALAIRAALGERANAASTRVALAMVDAREGRGSEARVAVLAALPDLQRTRASEKEALAHATLAMAALAGGDPADGGTRLAEAEEAAERARALAARGENVVARLTAELVAGRVSVARGRSAAAMASLARAAAAARRLGLVPLALEADLVRARAAGGRGSADRARVAREAETLGLRALAAEARASDPAVRRAPGATPGPPASRSTGSRRR